MINQVKLPNCNHTAMGHLFYHILCPQQTVSIRVGQAVLGALLILGVVWKAYSPSAAHSNPPPPPPPLQPTVIERYTQTAKLAIESAQDMLKQTPITETPKFQLQPLNKEIADLTILFEKFWSELGRDFITTLKNPSKAPEHQKILDTADKLMKVAFAIGCLTLEELEPFTQKYPGHGETPLKALTGQRSYQYRTFFFCPRAYNRIRKALSWKNIAQGQGEWVAPRENSIQKSHSAPFYQPNTPQRTWRVLYNEYCDRVRMYVDEKELDVKDSRFTQWTENDTDPVSFSFEPVLPSTLPT